MPRATAQAFPSIWQQTGGLGALPPLQGEVQHAPLPPQPAQAQGPPPQQAQQAQQAQAQQAEQAQGQAGAPAAAAPPAPPVPPAMEMTRSGLSGPLDALALLAHPTEADPTCPLVAAVAADPPSGLDLDGKPLRQVQTAQQQLSQLAQQQTQQQQRQAQLMKQLQSTQQELAELIGRQGTPGAGPSAAAAGFRPISPSATASLTTTRVLPGALVRMLTAAVPPHAVLSGTKAWFELFEASIDDPNPIPRPRPSPTPHSNPNPNPNQVSIEDLNRDSAKPLTVVSLFGPETDIEEGARVLAAAASQIATRSGGGRGLGEG